MTAHAVGASATGDVTQNSYQKAVTASSGTSFAAGDSFTFANNGHTLLVLHVTTSGTGTIEALDSGDDVDMTLTATADYVIGPLDPSVFGSSVTVTTATAVGDYATFDRTASFHNALHNPFESTDTAPDYN